MDRIGRTCRRRVNISDGFFVLYVVEQGLTRKLNDEIMNTMNFILLELRNEEINAKTILAVTNATGLGFHYAMA